MKIRFANRHLRRLAEDEACTLGFAPQVEDKYRFVVNYIDAADDIRALYALKSLRMERLAGGRRHQHSLRLNLQWRLIIQVVDGKPEQSVLIEGIEDYH